MTASRLSIYQGACLALGERKIMSLTESRKTRRDLDGVWDRGGVQDCLQAGLWNFATRSLQYDYSPSVEPSYGYRRAFNKPDDWVRTVAVCQDEYYKVPLLEYIDEAAYWFASLDTIYVRFVSNDPSFGLNFGAWPTNFTRYVEFYFAWKIIQTTTQSTAQKQDLEKDLKKALLEAKNTDAMDEATAFPPPGTWAKARRGYRSRLDWGLRDKLIGE